MRPIPPTSPRGSLWSAAAGAAVALAGAALVIASALPASADHGSLSALGTTPDASTSVSTSVSTSTSTTTSTSTSTSTKTTTPTTTTHRTTTATVTSGHQPTTTHASATVAQQRTTPLTTPRRTPGPIPAAVDAGQNDAAAWQLPVGGALIALGAAGTVTAIVRRTSTKR